MTGDGTPMPALDPAGLPYPRLQPESAWRAELTPLEYAVLRLGATEPPGTSRLPGPDPAQRTGDDTAEPDGAMTYACRACGLGLFTSAESFDSHCGWPSFFRPLAGDRVVELVDRSLGMVRTEVRCAGCGSHLGHVFEGEGYRTPTDLRYCINGVCLRPASRD